MKVKYTISKRNDTPARVFVATERVGIKDRVAVFVNRETTETVIYPLDWVSMIHGEVINEV